jgi:AraC-like DNA-binding protein
MIVQSIFPDARVAPFVHSIVVLENSNAFGAAILPLIAKGYPSIVFLRTQPSPMAGLQSATQQLLLFGQNILPIHIPVAGTVHLIAYFIYPHQLFSLFGLYAKELTDTSIDLDTTTAARGMRLKEQLLNAPSLQQRLQLLNHYVLQLGTSVATPGNSMLAYAVELIQKNKGRLAVTQLPKTLYTTERSLQRLFDQHLGLSPKIFSRICQFQHALGQLERSGFSQAANIAYDCGYADQSHLIRAFKAFTHYSPQEYLKRAEDFPA